MATITTTPLHSIPQRQNKSGHLLRLWIAWIGAILFIAILAVYGFPYYVLSMEERPESPLHSILRPSGAIGLKLGMLGVALFFVLFLYPLRKRWRWLSSQGRTPHWLDFHVLVGISAPLVITFHSSFKFAGLAGIAYWIMVAVAVSGFLGRYIYSQIPRSLNATQLDLGEIESQSAELSAQLERQNVFRTEELAPLLQTPSRDQVKSMGFTRMLCTLLFLDFRRPFQVSRLRRRILTRTELFGTVGGFRPSHHADLEAVVASVRRQSRLAAKTAFLNRTQKVFHLWHVIHRPFSISFAILVVVHIVIAVMLGYY